jgi:hypothetical protein
MEKKDRRAACFVLLLIFSLTIPLLRPGPARAEESAEVVIQEKVVSPGETRTTTVREEMVPSGEAQETMVQEETVTEEENPFPLNVELHGRVQMAWKMTGGDQSGLQDGYLPQHDGFYIPRWRFGLHAETFENVFINVEVGETDNRRTQEVNLLDANIRLGYFDFANLILGAQKTPVGRNHMTSSKDMEFIERPLVATQLMVPTQTEDYPFVINQNGLGLPDRDVGIQLHGRFFEGILKYYLGMFNGTGEFFDDNWDGKFAYTARVAVNPLGEFPLAEGDFARELKAGVGATFFQNNVGNGKYVGYGADLDLRWYGASIRFEWMESQSSFSEKVPVVDPLLIKDKTFRGGWYVQAGFFVWPNYLELVGRFQQYDDNSRLNDLGDVTYTTVGGNWYIRQDHSYKLQLSYTWREEDVNPIDNDALYALAQVAF